MSTQCLNWAIRARTGSGTKKLVLLLLADHADEQHTCYPKIDTLAERSELSESAIEKAIAALRDAGFLRVLRRAKRSGGRRSNRYLLLVYGEQTPLPDVEDWVSESAGQSKPVAGTGMPEQPDESAGQSKPVREAGLPESIKPVTGTGSNPSQVRVSSNKEVEPPSVTKDSDAPPPTSTHPVDDISSAAAAAIAADWARDVLRRVTADVDVLRMPTAVERGRLVERVAALLADGWSAPQLVDRLLGMGGLATVASVYAVLSSRLGHVGDPPPPAPATNPVGGPALPWCGSATCDRTTRRRLDDEQRPAFAMVEGAPRALWCEDCSGR
jgi:DNA-binding transcriptional ArsR family regulator